jgi:ferredoxin-type protein NapH
MSEPTYKPFFLWRHLNKLRWVALSFVFAMLVLLPFLHVYQTYVAAHAYDLLTPSEKYLYDSMEAITAPFTNDPAEDLDAIKGNTWSGTFWGLKLSDPLAVLAQTMAGLKIYWPFAVTALIPVVLTALLGRFFCGWICPATLLYELNTNLAAWLRWAGLRLGNHRFDRRIKYGVLLIGLILSAASGSILIAAIYPPAIIGREIYYVIALGGFGAGTVFFLGTLLFDTLVARRGFCRYLCPGARAGRCIPCSDDTGWSVSAGSPRIATIAPSAMRSANSNSIRCATASGRNATIARPVSRSAPPTP